MTVESNASERVLAQRVVAMQRGGFNLKDMPSPSNAATPGTEGRVPDSPEVNGPAELHPEVPPLDDLAPLPGPGEPYKAHARASNKPVPMLHLLMADASVRGFSFANLEMLDLRPPSDPGQGPVIAARFTGLTPVDVTISGRNLDKLYFYLGLHRITWVKQRPPLRDFISEKETVVTGITIGKVVDY